MNRSWTWRVLALASLVALGGALHAGETPAQVEITTSAGLEMLKSLEGTWVKVGEDGRPTDEVVSVYSVTAAGSAVQEVLFPGTDHEMVTVYHHDGADLVLTHYCALGNQPRMKAESASDGAKLVFKCRGGSNMASENDAHMHEAVITRLGEGRLVAEWTQFKDGVKNYATTFDLARKN